MSCHRDCNIYLNQDMENCAMGHAFGGYKDNKVTHCNADAWKDYKICIEKCNNSTHTNKKKE